MPIPELASLVTVTTAVPVAAIQRSLFPDEVILPACLARAPTVSTCWR
jgi:hypothetical protein